MKALGLITSFNRLLISEYVVNTFDLNFFDFEWGNVCYQDEEGCRLDADALKITEHLGEKKVFYVYFDKYYGIQYSMDFKDIDMAPMPGHEGKDGYRFFTTDLPF